jgi:hypothetical protein
VYEVKAAAVSTNGASVKRQPVVVLLNNCRIRLGPYYKKARVATAST